jgi:diadenylate cyclase
VGTLLDYLAYLQVDWKDLVEILVVAYLFYRLLLLWTGTRALQILLGLVLLVGVYGTANYLDLGLIEYILSQAFTYGAFALIVVFQPELRNGLAQLGQSRLWRFFPKLEESEVAEEIAEAADRLSRAKIGGLIAIEREVGLEEYAENNGTRIQAEVSAELLTTIFTPYSPLHDGAVIVRGDQIVAAGCILPLTKFPVEEKSLGTRHRAALGLSEETDAYVVVISEETSHISLAHRGRLIRDLSPEELRGRLAAPAEPAPEAPAPEAEGEADEAGPDSRGEPPEQRVVTAGEG